MYRSLKYFLPLVLVLLVPFFSRGQSREDSLKRELSNAKHDTTKLRLRFNIGVGLSILREPYWDSIYRDAKKLGVKRIEAMTLCIIGFIVDDDTKALEFYTQAVKIQEEIGDKDGLSQSLGNIAVIYDERGDIERALLLNERALKLSEETNNKGEIASNLNNIGSIYQSQGELKKALEYYKKGEVILKEIGEDQGRASCLNNIGIIYKKLGDLGKALAYYTTSLKLRETDGNKRGVVYSLNNIGTIYDLQDNVSLALEYYNRALKLAEEIQDKKGLALSFNNVARALLKKGDISEAQVYGQKAMEAAKNLGAPENIRNSALTLKNIYRKQNNFKAAFEMYELEVKMRDSINNNETRKAAIKSQFKYDYEKKAAVLKEQQEKEKIVTDVKNSRQRSTIISISSIGIISLLIALLILRQKKFRTEQRGLQLEQKLLRSQMNPHFIFNSLTAIESFIYKNEPKIAGRYLSGFARLMRLILENSREEYVTLEKEIQTLEHYLNLQRLRYDGNFDYSIVTDEDIDPAMVSIPPMLAQPFIENSIEHGLKGITHKGKIQVKFSLKENELQFEVEDNGIGFDASVKIKGENQHRSMATTITMERLKILNKRKNQKIKWLAEDIRDTLNGISGARVVFSIPLA
jgi:tetratricopeptide (TPR) repeat protein